MIEKNQPFSEEAEVAAFVVMILMDDPLEEGMTHKAAVEANNKETNSTKLKMFPTLR